MLQQLESLEIEQLQEAALYFEQSASATGYLLPRREHERAYLDRARSEGRLAAARLFLVTLRQMTTTAAGPSEMSGDRTEPAAGASAAEQRDVRPEQLPHSRSPDAVLDSPVSALVLPAAVSEQRAGMRQPPRASLANHGRTAVQRRQPFSVFSCAGVDGHDAGHGGEGWELQPKQKRRSRRRRLWAADKSTSGSAGFNSACGTGRFWAASSDGSYSPPLACGPSSHSTGDDGGNFNPGQGCGMARSLSFNAPLPAWTSWADTPRREGGQFPELATMLGNARNEGDLPPASRIVPCQLGWDGVPSAKPEFTAVNGENFRMNAALVSMATVSADNTSQPVTASMHDASVQGSARKKKRAPKPSFLASFVSTSPGASPIKSTTLASGRTSPNVSCVAFSGEPFVDILSPVTHDNEHLVVGSPPDAGGAWGAFRSFAAVVRGPSPDGFGGSTSLVRGPSVLGCSISSAGESTGRREKLLSPDRKTAEAIAEEARSRQARAEAQREQRAAEEAFKLQKKREREAQVVSMILPLPAR